MLVLRKQPLVISSERSESRDLKIRFLDSAFGLARNDKRGQKKG